MILFKIHLISKKKPMNLPFRLTCSMAVACSLICSIASADPTPFPDSEIAYPGASTSKAFTAINPYELNIGGVTKEGDLLGQSRSFDFGGDIPFVNPVTLASDPEVIQSWLTGAGATNLADKQITYTGLTDHIEKRANVDPLSPATELMIRTIRGDGMNGLTARSFLVSYPVPPRTHVRWDLEVAFGRADGVNDWELTPVGTHPVLFWELKSKATGHPALSAVIDTDNVYPDRLMMVFYRGAGEDRVKQITVVRNLPRFTYIPVTIDAFLDERAKSDVAGKGRYSVKVNGRPIFDLLATSTLHNDGSIHSTAIGAYAYNDIKDANNPEGLERYTRATFWKTARMLVYPPAP